MREVRKIVKEVKIKNKICSKRKSLHTKQKSKTQERMRGGKKKKDRRGGFVGLGGTSVEENNGN